MLGVAWRVERAPHIRSLGRLFRVGERAIGRHPPGNRCQRAGTGDGNDSPSPAGNPKRHVPPQPSPSYLYQACPPGHDSWGARIFGSRAGLSAANETIRDESCREPGVLAAPACRWAVFVSAIPCVGWPACVLDSMHCKARAKHLKCLTNIGVTPSNTS